VFGLFCQNERFCQNCQNTFSCLINDSQDILFHIAMSQRRNDSLNSDGQENEQSPLTSTQCT
jgi:hypothetical protein